MDRSFFAECGKDVPHDVVPVLAEGGAVLAQQCKQCLVLFDPEQWTCAVCGRPAWRRYGKPAARYCGDACRYLWRKWQRYPVGRAFAFLVAVAEGNVTLFETEYGRRRKDGSS